MNIHLIGFWENVSKVCHSQIGIFEKNHLELLFSDDIIFLKNIT